MSCPRIRRHCRARVVYYGHDLHFRRMKQQAEVTRDDRLLRAADQMREREFAIWRQADLSLYLSEEEAADRPRPAARRPGSDRCYRIVSIVRRSARGAARSRRSSSSPASAIRRTRTRRSWFVHEILPLIRAEVPAAHLSIIGSNPTARVRALAGDGIAMFANVTDAELAAAYDRARVAVVPLRCGAGVKLKVVEALRAGMPLVTTPVGAQGLPGSVADCRRWRTIPHGSPGRGPAAALTTRFGKAAARRRSQFAQARFSKQAMKSITASAHWRSVT